MKWEDQTYRQSSQFPSSLDTGLWWPRPWVRLKRTRGGPFAPPLPCLTVPEETPGLAQKNQLLHRVPEMMVEAFARE